MAGAARMGPCGAAVSCVRRIPTSPRLAQKVLSQLHRRGYPQRSPPEKGRATHPPRGWRLQGAPETCQRVAASAVIDTGMRPGPANSEARRWRRSLSFLGQSQARASPQPSSSAGLLHAPTLRNSRGFCVRITPVFVVENGFSGQKWGVRSRRPISEELQRDDAGSPRRRPRGNSHRVRCIADPRWNWGDLRSGVPAQRGRWSLCCGRGCRAAAPSRASATGCAGVHRRGHGCDIATIRHKFWERCRYSSPRCAGGRRASMERIHRRRQRMGWVQ